MLAIATEITIYLLLAALIGFIIGYLVGKMSKTKNKEAIKTTKPAKKVVVSAVDTIVEEEVKVPTSPAIEEVEETVEDIEKQEGVTQPTLLNAPTDKTKDPLTQIKGIGPKVEEQLNAAGIYYFEQIANWDAENIAWLETHTTFAHRAKKDLWVMQATALI